MEKHKRNPEVQWRSLFPDSSIQIEKAEKELAYHSAHFGIRALEYLVFIGTLLTLGLFTAAVFQVVADRTAGFYFTMAALLLGTNILLHLLVRQRLIDALATGFGAFGIVSLMAALFEMRWADKNVALVIIAVLVVLIVISRKNLLTILGIVAILWLLFWFVDEQREIPIYQFKLVLMIFTLILALLIWCEELIISRFTSWSYFFNYLKHGFFVALASHYIFGFIDWSHWKVAKEPAWYNVAMYAEILILAAALFTWQYRRMKNEHVPLWLVVFLPLSLFLLGVFSVKIGFFLLAFLAFLFTRSIFGIVTAAMGLIYAVIHFYYELEWTLMQKSLLFIGLGVLYIALYLVLISKKRTS
jgi:uncharacterized membrane protein